MSILPEHCPIKLNWINGCGCCSDDLFCELKKGHRGRHKYTSLAPRDENGKIKPYSDSEDIEIFWHDLAKEE